MGRVGRFVNQKSLEKRKERDGERARITGKKVWKQPWKHALFLENNRKKVLKSIKNERWDKKKEKRYVKWKGIRLNLYHYRFNNEFLKLRIKGKEERWEYERPIWGLKEGYRILNIATANVGGLGEAKSKRLLAKHYRRCNLDIIGLQETNGWRDEDDWIGNYRLITVKGDRMNNGKRRNGVGVIFLFVNTLL